MFGLLIRLINIPARIADETLSHMCSEHGTSRRDERLLSGFLDDVADEVDDVEDSVKKSIKRGR